jgi:KTSC domain
MIPVSSSNIASIGYDSLTSTLQIEFHDNSVYQYFNVPESVFNALMNASSKGKYASENIYKQYSQRKIS